MRRVSLGLLFVATLGGCFNYSEPICSFSCGTGTGAEVCPGSYECRADGYFVTRSAPPKLAISAIAALAPDLSAIPDQGPDLASDGGPMSDEGLSPSMDQAISD